MASDEASGDIKTGASGDTTAEAASPVPAALIETILAELSARYSEPHRHYHTLRHIRSMLSLLHQHVHLFADPGAVALATVFHDAVYDPRAPARQNEEQSAALAVERLTELGWGNEERVAWVRSLVLATADHQLPAEMSHVAGWPRQSRERDMALFLDMDLAILGAPEDEFDEYEAAVRREYGFVDDDGWRKGRRAVLLRLAGYGGEETLGPDAAWAVFKTGTFCQGVWGKRVQGNLERSLRRLEG